MQNPNFCYISFYNDWITGDQKLSTEPVMLLKWDQNWSELIWIEKNILKNLLSCIF